MRGSFDFQILPESSFADIIQNLSRDMSGLDACENRAFSIRLRQASLPRFVFQMMLQVIGRP
jgi:hypothetical protein